MIAVASYNAQLPCGQYQGRVQFLRKPTAAQALEVSNSFRRMIASRATDSLLTMCLITVPGEPDRVVHARRSTSIQQALGER